jgi:shikimate 5-dehydrogenase
MYSENNKDEQLIKLVGSKRHRSKSPEIRRAVIADKRLKGEELSLDEKRSEEAEAVKKVLK